jgi:alkanesulfonate monooxygenase SsuD/methylene tetrahydromethanopterin reductase-like flavin-dependent oxidoreductase (luciferase family)
LTLSTIRPLQLAIALDGAGWHPAAWREPGACPAELFTGRYWLEQVRQAQDGLLDFVTIEDSHRLQSSGEDGPDGRTDQVRGRLDATLVAAWIAPHTRHIGIVPAAGTTLTEPFLLSTQIATLDFVSRGRAGWHAFVSTGPGDAAYAGPRSVAVGDAAWAEAGEHIEVVRRLWDSWEDGAEIRDVSTNRFIDRRRVHHIDFVGEHLRVKGPSITPRPPQGQPIVAMVAGTGTGAATEFAVRHADVIFIAPHEEDELASERRRIDELATAAARNPSSVRALADVVVFLDSDAGAARERRDRLDRSDGAAHRFDTLVFTGTPTQLADRLLDWRELGYDGFRLRPGTVPHDLRGITRDLVAELQLRGAFRRRYEAGSLRELLGLGRPHGRYGPHPPDPVAVT